MTPIRRLSSVLVPALLALPISTIRAQDAGEAFADRLRAYNHALDYSGGVAEGRANPRALRNPRARAWYALLLARDNEGRAALALADSLLAADRNSTWGWFARTAALGYGFNDSSAAAIAASDSLYLRAPHHPDVVWLRAATLMNEGSPSAAFAPLDSFLARNPRSVGHMVLRANAAWSSATAVRPPNPALKDSALALWARARTLDSTDVLAWAAAGSRLLNDRRMEEAAPLLRRAAELAPLSTAVNRDYWRALRGVHSRNPERATAEALPGIQRILAARGSDPAVLQGLASEYEAFRMPDEQRATEERALREHPNSVAAEWILVNRYRAVGNRMRDTTVRDSTLKGTYVRMLREFIARSSHVNEGLVGEAYLSLFMTRDSATHPDTLLSMVLGMERYERLNPHITYALGALALAEAGAHLDQAERIAREGQRAGRRQVESRRQFYEGIGEYAQALDWMNSTMIDALGWVHFRAGRLQDAEQELRQAIDLNRRNHTAFNHLGRLFEAGRQLDSAESYYIRGAMVPVPFVNPSRTSLQALYVSRRGSADGYDQYYAGIREIDRARRRAAVAAELRAARDRAELPAFRMATLGDDTVRSGALAGRIAVINFWGTWCGPCVAEMQEIQRFSAQVAQDTAVRFLTISNDQDLRELRQFMERRRYSFPVLLDAGYTSRSGVQAWPTTWFVDRSGRIAFVKEGWSEELAEEFGWRVEILKAEPISP